jgi:hypothetical protein
MEEAAMMALLRATHASTQAIAERQELILRSTEQELAVLRVERDLLVRRVAALEAAHSELQRTRAQLGDALRRAARAEMDAQAARSRLVFRGAKMLLQLVRGSTGGSHLLGERGKGVVLVDIVGWPADDLEHVLDRLADRRDADGTVMILLTDSERFDLYRARGFVFEYLAGDGADRAERVAELSAAYRLDRVLIAETDGALREADGGERAADTVVAR